MFVANLYSVVSSISNLSPSPPPPTVTSFINGATGQLGVSGWVGVSWFGAQVILIYDPVAMCSARLHIINAKHCAFPPLKLPKSSQLKVRKARLDEYILYIHIFHLYKSILIEYGPDHHLHKFEWLKVPSSPLD